MENLFNNTITEILEVGSLKEEVDEYKAINQPARATKMQ